MEPRRDANRGPRRGRRRVSPVEPARRSELSLRSGMLGILAVVAAAGLLALSAWLLAAGIVRFTVAAS